MLAQPVHLPIVTAIAQAVQRVLGSAQYAAIINDAGQLAPYVTFTRSSTATRYNSAGLLETVAANAPRYDYDPLTLQLRGLLIEEQRTNLLTYSEEFDNAAWAKPATASITANAGVAPNGLTQADKLVDNPSAAEHGIYRSITVSSHVYSVYAKAAELSVIYFRFRQATGQALSVAFDLANGTVCKTTNQGTYYTSGVGSIQPVGNGWYRCSVYVACASLTSNVFISVANTNNPTFTTNGDYQYSGNGTDGVLIWGAQLEAGAFATSYIPTTTASVTRAASSATATTLSDIGFNASTGTLYFEGVAPPSVAVATTLASFNDNTANESISLHMNAGGALRAQVIDGGVTVADLALGTLTARQSFKAALSYVENDIKGCLNGGTVQADTSATLPTVDRLMIGRGSAGNAWNGHVRKLRYYRTAKNTQELTA